MAVRKLSELQGLSSFNRSSLEDNDLLEVSLNNEGDGGGYASAQVSVSEIIDSISSDINTANTIIIRNALGNAKVSDPLVANDIATKGYIDNKFTLNGSNLYIT